MVRRILGFVLCIAVVLGVASCSFDPKETVTNIQYYNDAGSVFKYIYGLDDYESIEYEAVVHTTRVSMGPHEPLYRGVIVLDGDLAEEIWNKYEWQEADPEPFEFEKLDTQSLNDDTWYYSEEFAKDTIKYEPTDYIYFNGSKVVFSFRAS